MESPQRIYHSEHAALAVLAGLVLLLTACAQVDPRSRDVGPYPRTAITPIASPKSTSDFPDAAALSAAPRLALVIGNNAYQNPSWQPLKLARNDADAVGGALRQRGFVLIGGAVQHDVSAQNLRQLIDDTVRAVRIKPGAIVVVYFSGHGFVDQGHNYLVPVDAPDQSQAAQASLGVIDVATRLRAAGSGLTAMFLDACRSYLPGRGGGLADEAVPDNTFIGFAAQFGTVVPEDPETGSFSRYAGTLVERLGERFAYLDDFHLAISTSVIRASLGHQAPVFRQATRMPTSRTRLAQNTPSIDLAARQCASQADLRLTFSDPRFKTQFKPYTIGPGYELTDIIEIEKSCIAAYNSGRRDVGVLRGLAAVWSIEVTIFNRPDFPGGVENTIAFLVQAAESGDTLANFYLAVAAGDSKFGPPLTAVTDRLVFAAQQNDTFVASLVGVMLWHPLFESFRAKKFLPESPALGIQITKRLAMEGDSFSLAWILSTQRRNPAFSELRLRDGFNRALSKKDPTAGVYINGTTVRDTLMLLAIMDAANTEDWGQFSRLMVQADPLLDRVIAAATAAGLPVGRLAATFRVLAGCFYGSGKDLDGHPVGEIAADRNLSTRFLHEAADTGNAKAQQVLAALAKGDTCTRS